MTLAPNYHLAEELHYLLQTADVLSAREVAACALEHLERLSDAEQKAEIGRQLLGSIASGTDIGAPVAGKALQVMEHFPHYARPRAAVAMAALKELAQGKKLAA